MTTRFNVANMRRQAPAQAGIPAQQRQLEPWQYGNRYTLKQEDGVPIVKPGRDFLYDRKVVGTPASQQITYFRGALGSTPLDTNLTGDGVLNGPQEFYIFGVTFITQFGIPIADLNNLYNGASLEIFVGSNGKKILQIPLHMVPAGGGLSGFTTLTNVQQAANGVPSPDNFLSLDVEGDPYKLKTGEPFRGLLTIAAPAVFSAQFNTWLYLHGYSVKEA